ncbi:MAG: type II toxin-antitoxin system Phd/YefM family antitoxin [Burkholderiales bacterium]
MKTISLKELHAQTGAWVRKAASLGAIMITDCGRAIARITSVELEVPANPFLTRKVRRGYARLKGKLSAGTDSSVVVSEDRGGR